LKGKTFVYTLKMEIFSSGSSKEKYRFSTTKNTESYIQREIE